jgi:hypothetical protein
MGCKMMSGLAEIGPRCGSPVSPTGMTPIWVVSAGLSTRAPPEAKIKVRAAPFWPCRPLAAGPTEARCRVPRGLLHERAFAGPVEGKLAQVGGRRGVIAATARAAAGLGEAPAMRDGSKVPTDEGDSGAQRGIDAAVGAYLVGDVGGSHGNLLGFDDLEFTEARQLRSDAHHRSGGLFTLAAGASASQSSG